MIVQEFLNEKHVPFEMIDHRPTYDAKSLARATHVAGKHVAKAVVLKVDGQCVLAIVPATHSIDFQKVRSTLDADSVQLASETECGDRFRDCEFGARPPFGAAYLMRTLIDKSLLGSDEIVFEGNTHRQAIRMRLRDFQNIEHPQVASFSRHH